MPSPFLPYSNAILTLEELSENLVENPTTGNWEATPGATTTFKAFLTQDKSREVTEALFSQGGDDTRTYLKGYLVEPMFFPASVSFPSQLRCSLTLPNGSSIEGTFDLRLVAGSAVGADAITGQKVKGYFYVRG